jgi:hypothetical protein
VSHLLANLRSRQGCGRDAPHCGCAPPTSSSYASINRTLGVQKSPHYAYTLSNMFSPAIPILKLCIPKWSQYRRCLQVYIHKIAVISHMIESCRVTRPIHMDASSANSGINNRPCTFLIIYQSMNNPPKQIQSRAMQYIAA